MVLNVLAEKQDAAVCIIDECNNQRKNWTSTSWKPGLCNKHERKKWNAAHKIINSERAKKYNAEHKSEKKAYGEKYRKKNKIELRRYDIKYKKMNREQIRIKDRQKYKDNPEYYLTKSIKQMKKIADEMGISFNKYMYATIAWSKTIKKGQTCNICGSNKNLEAHHILYKSTVPELQYNINNGITLCRECHYETHGKRMEVRHGIS